MEEDSTMILEVRSKSGSWTASSVGDRSRPRQAELLARPSRLADKATWAELHCLLAGGPARSRNALPERADIKACSLLQRLYEIGDGLGVVGRDPT